MRSAQILLQDRQRVIQPACSARMCCPAGCGHVLHKLQTASTLCALLEADAVLSRGPAVYLARGVVELPVADLKSDQRFRQAQPVGVRVTGAACRRGVSGADRRCSCPVPMPNAQCPHARHERATHQSPTQTGTTEGCLPTASHPVGPDRQCVSTMHASLLQVLTMYTKPRHGRYTSSAIGIMIEPSEAAMPPSW